MHMGKIGQKSAAFINHKPFHPGNYRNLEKVWLAEQTHAANLKKQQELLDKRQQESKVEELRRALHEGAYSAGGKLDVARDDVDGVSKLEWMYRSSDQMDQDEQEALLTGARELPTQRNDEIHRIKLLENTKEAAGALLLKDKNTSFGDAANPNLNKDDMIRKMREDPLFAIRQAQVAFRKQREANPLDRVKRLRQQLEESRAMYNSQNTSEKPEFGDSGRDAKRRRCNENHSRSNSLAAPRYDDQKYSRTRQVKSGTSFDSEDEANGRRYSHRKREDQKPGVDRTESQEHWSVQRSRYRERSAEGHSSRRRRSDSVERRPFTERSSHESNRARHVKEENSESTERQKQSVSDWRWLERERRREIEREFRLERAGKKGKRLRDQQRDIAEQVALGEYTPPVTCGAGSLFGSGHEVY
eukprot:Gregarina_sp_Poly_1__7627@NODE_428_length_8567_cov_88_085529_g349_i0_p4_GENE_NODE_428_length_8567_cov_88_085529_g349_i0NODE_428_length_8567_cov_88_085529_g349_i0_p4_ORF_typecomplete_len416_score59_62CWC25/PF12542_8/2_5e03CWC25/PF12542_8/8_9e12CWC25/PF12542_8/1_8e04Cir_N/PF10197_9/1e10Cir_N/PF10197_9/1_2e03Cir_N/PF10197_9/9_1e03Cir_N/PF10197_9/4_4e03Cir_N/PF10197_9/4_4e03Cir_N/PF10197_9/9_7e03FlgM/PF04316_13/0_59FlgM/PF04316_13/88FlgM/PF04316_13/1_7e03DUF1064/PF06356_11/7_4e03DUF1064/PF06356_11/0